MKYVIIFIVIFGFSFVQAGNYGSGYYGADLYGSEELSSISTASSGGSSSGGSSGGTIIECSNNLDCGLDKYCFGNKCYEAECFDDSVCNIDEGETCFEYKCVKLFDMEILNFESPVKVGEFFNFTYFIKAVAEINGDVEVMFWIENRTGYIPTSGKDTFYMGSYEEKTKTKQLFLPEDIDSGTYEFNIQITYQDYTASAHRTIGIEVRKGVAKIDFENKEDFKTYIIAALIGLAVFIICWIFYLERKKIRKGLIKETKWIKKHKVSVLVLILLIAIGVLIYLFYY